MLHTAPNRNKLWLDLCLLQQPILYRSRLLPPPAASIWNRLRVVDILGVAPAFCGCCAHRAIEEREATRTAALAKAEMAKTAFEEVRQVSSELERKRLNKLEQDRVAVRGIAYAYVWLALLHNLPGRSLLCDPQPTAEDSSRALMDH